MLTGEDIIEHAQKILLDDATQPAGAGIQWAEIAIYLFARIRKLIKDKPDAHVVTEPFQLAEGPMQEAPEDTVVILDIPRNTTEAGQPGRAITPVLMVDLDNSDPDWPTRTGNNVLHFMHDAKEPLKFYVYPAKEDGYVMLKRASLPDYDDETDPLPVGDEYEMALVYGVIAECYSKNAIRGDTAKAAFYESLYAQELGIKTATQQTHAGGTVKDSADQ